MKRIILMVFAFLLISCGEVDVPTQTNSDGLEYSIIEVEGMPCILVQSVTYSSYMVKSLDCDWSKWEGNE